MKITWHKWTPFVVVQGFVVQLEQFQTPNVRSELKPNYINLFIIGHLLLDYFLLKKFTYHISCKIFYILISNISTAIMKRLQEAWVTTLLFLWLKDTLRWLMWTKCCKNWIVFTQDFTLKFSMKSGFGTTSKKKWLYNVSFGTNFLE